MNYRINYLILTFTLTIFAACAAIGPLSTPTAQDPSPSLPGVTTPPIGNNLDHTGSSTAADSLLPEPPAYQSDSESTGSGQALPGSSIPPPMAIKPPLKERILAYYPDSEGITPVIGLSGAIELPENSIIDEYVVLVSPQTLNNEEQLNLLDTLHAGINLTASPTIKWASSRSTIWDWIIPPLMADDENLQASTCPIRENRSFECTVPFIPEGENYALYVVRKDGMAISNEATEKTINTNLRWLGDAPKDIKSSGPNAEILLHERTLRLTTDNENNLRVRVFNQNSFDSGLRYKNHTTTENTDQLAANLNNLVYKDKTQGVCLDTAAGCQPEQFVNIPDTLTYTDLKYIDGHFYFSTSYADAMKEGSLFSADNMDPSNWIKVHQTAEMVYHGTLTFDGASKHFLAVNHLVGDEIQITLTQIISKYKRNHLPSPKYQLDPISLSDVQIYHLPSTQQAGDHGRALLIDQLNQRLLVVTFRASCPAGQICQPNVGITHQLTLPQSPLALALNEAKTKAYVIYESNMVTVLDLDTEDKLPIAAAHLELKGLGKINENTPVQTQSLDIVQDKLIIGLKDLMGTLLIPLTAIENATAQWQLENEYTASEIFE